MIIKKLILLEFSIKKINNFYSILYIFFDFNKLYLLFILLIEYFI